ncbi:toxin-antitoxin system HicB family antitoxin [Actinomycetospora chiangmaiensis]|uniref:toxin-antitoxin system HicB family antitoxin n=1 Tax=Actinomycetospora chiangmaiensis TaxID=402650 RepID=UPI000370441E|nr:toxin-antitoxin system HicB family antitoxin [Actinomycetospora chiangmaiensis]
MDLTPYVTALRDDLAAAASVGDEQTARAGTALAGALEPAVRLALQSALSDLTAEISEKLDDRSVSLRLRGREVEVVVDRDGGADAGAGFFAGPSSSPFAGPGGPFSRPGDAAGRGADMGDISRMTLRLVDQIKGQAEQAAAAQGMSLNSWISQAVQGALRDNLGRHGQRRWQGSWDPEHRSGTRPEPPERPEAPEPPVAPEAPAPDAGPGRDRGPGSGPGSGPDDEGGSGVTGWVRG